MSHYPNQYSHFSGHFASGGSQYSVNQIATDMYELNNRRMSLAYTNQVYGLPNIPVQIQPNNNPSFQYTNVLQTPTIYENTSMYAPPAPLPPLQSRPTPFQRATTSSTLHYTIPTTPPQHRPLNSSRTSSTRRSSISNRSCQPSKTASNRLPSLSYSEQQNPSQTLSVCESKCSNTLTNERIRSRGLNNSIVGSINVDPKDDTAVTLQEFDDAGSSMLVNEDDLTYRATSENINQHSEIVSSHNLPPSTANNSVRSNSNLENDYNTQFTRSNTLNSEKQREHRHGN